MFSSKPGVFAHLVRHRPVIPPPHCLVLERAPRIPVTGEVHDQIQVDDPWTPVGFCWIILFAEVTGPVIPRARDLSIRMIEQNPTSQRR
ncbi:hypothetical protein ACX801_07010 [Arthrobacter bambusae]